MRALVVDSVWSQLVQRAVIEEDGSAGPAASWLLEGGMARLRVDDPGTVVLYSNQSGGFRVSCPDCRANAVEALSSALGRWRSSGGPRRGTCPACGSEWALESLIFAPPAAFGRLSLVVADAGRGWLEDEASAFLDRQLGSHCVVARRP